MYKQHKQHWSTHLGRRHKLTPRDKQALVQNGSTECQNINKGTGEGVGGIRYQSTSYKIYPPLRESYISMAWKAVFQKVVPTPRLVWKIQTELFMWSPAFWRSFWSDETKIELFGHNNLCHIGRKGEAFNPQNTVPTVKHGVAALCCEDVLLDVCLF